MLVKTTTKRKTWGNNGIAGASKRSICLDEKKGVEAILKQCLDFAESKNKMECEPLKISFKQCQTAVTEKIVFWGVGTKKDGV